MDKRVDEEIIELQTRLTFQEQTIFELSNVVARQQREIDGLNRMLDRVQRQFGELLQRHGQTTDLEPPPHY